MALIPANGGGGNEPIVDVTTTPALPTGLSIQRKGSLGVFYAQGISTTISNTYTLPFSTPSDKRQYILIGNSGLTGLRGYAYVSGSTLTVAIQGGASPNTGYGSGVFLIDD